MPEFRPIQDGLLWHSEPRPAGSEPENPPSRVPQEGSDQWVRAAREKDNNDVAGPSH